MDTKHLVLIGHLFLNMVDHAYTMSKFAARPKGTSTRELDIMVVMVALEVEISMTYPPEVLSGYTSIKSCQLAN